MAVLKFRVMYEDDDTIFRDIEMKPSQTFADFESIIILAYNLPANGSGSFFISNDNWQKGKCLHPQPKSEVNKTTAKSKSRELPAMVSFIDDPHQHFLFEYYGSSEFSFLVELLALGSTENSKMIYPTVIRSQGPSPFKKEIVVEQIGKKKKTAANTEVPREIIEEDENEAEEESPFVIEAGDEASEEDLAELSDDSNVVDGADDIKMNSVKEEVDEDAFDDSSDFDTDDFSDDFNEESSSEEEEYER